MQVKKSYEAKRAKRKAQGRTGRNWRLARLPMEVHTMFRTSLSLVNIVLFCVAFMRAGTKARRPDSQVLLQQLHARL